MSKTSSIILGLLIIIFFSCKKSIYSSEESVGKVKQTNIPDTVNLNENLSIVITLSMSCAKFNRFEFHEDADTINCTMYQNRQGPCTTGSDSFIDQNITLKFNTPGMHYFKFNNGEFNEFIDSVFVKN